MKEFNDESGEFITQKFKEISDYFECKSLKEHMELLALISSVCIQVMLHLPEMVEEEVQRREYIS